MYEALVARVRYHIQKANFMGLKEAESTLLLAEAADAIEATRKAYQMMAEAYEAEATKQGWIPVTERLPEKYVNVLCHLRSLDRQSEYYSIDHLMEDGQWWKAANSWKHEATHWMPLPEPPNIMFYPQVDGITPQVIRPPKDGES